MLVMYGHVAVAYVAHVELLRGFVRHFSCGIFSELAAGKDAGGQGAAKRQNIFSCRGGTP